MDYIEDGQYLRARVASAGASFVDLSVVKHIAAAEDVDKPTPRQLEVLVHVAGGESNHAIAHHLDIAERTVEFHISRLFSKLGAASRTELVARARGRGWIS